MWSSGGRYLSPVNYYRVVLKLEDRRVVLAKKETERGFTFSAVGAGSARHLLRSKRQLDLEYLRLDQQSKPRVVGLNPPSKVLSESRHVLPSTRRGLGARGAGGRVRR